MTERSYKVSRRVFTATAGGFAAGLFATRLTRGYAHDATPGASPEVGAITPLGYVSMRIRVLNQPESRAVVNERVLNGFVGNVEALDGYEGYILGDVIDNDLQSVSVVVFDEESQVAAFNDVAKTFVESVGDMVNAEATREFAGDLLISGAPTGSDASPVAVPQAPLGSGYLAVRVHTSLPGTNPRDFVPLAISGFLPIVSGLEGFQGYLWFPVDGGFVAISLFDSEASAQASNEAAKDWAAEYLTDYTDGNPEIINANLVYANLPILNA